jgi:para-nitrobenzyl esterase
MSSGMNRRVMIGRSLSAVAAMSMPFPALARGAAGTVVAATCYGKVRGKREDGIVKFLGVPYAAPPLGELRFKAPKPLTPWSGVRDAVDFPNPAFQVAGAEMGPNGNGRMPAPSEDCLYLNTSGVLKRVGPRPRGGTHATHHWAASVRSGRLPVGESSGRRR